MKPYFLLSSLILIAGLVGASTVRVDGASDDRSPIVKVMSFNIRYGAADDGTNSWTSRAQLVSETIRTFGPDLLGLQEVLGFQAAFLRKELPGYGFHGVGREDGIAKGEFVPLMYRKNRFDLVDSGHFWLSETPEVPGSKSWDSSLPRMLSWVILRDRLGEAAPFVFANTHFDHRGPLAREASARLIRERAGLVAPDHPIILVGDFNTTELRAPYKVFVGSDGDGVAFLDSYRVIHPVRVPQEATFSAWHGARDGERIDWILHTSEWMTLNARINYTQYDGKHPSDHYPVEAMLLLRSSFGNR